MIIPHISLFNKFSPWSQAKAQKRSSRAGRNFELNEADCDYYTTDEAVQRLDPDLPGIASTCPLVVNRRDEERDLRSKLCPRFAHARDLRPLGPRQRYSEGVATIVCNTPVCSNSDCLLYSAGVPRPASGLLLMQQPRGVGQKGKLIREALLHILLMRLPSAASHGEFFREESTV